MNFAVSQSVNFSDIKYGIPKLRSDNYKIWKERVLLHLGCMDVDYAIKKKEPSVITETNTSDAVDLCEKWETSNHLFVTFIKTNIYTSTQGSIDQHDNVKDLLKSIDE